MTLLTTSEARAEAASIVLHVLLDRLTRRELGSLYRHAKAEAGTIGLTAIEDEVAWICREAREATSDMLARDECA